MGPDCSGKTGIPETPFVDGGSVVVHDEPHDPGEAKCQDDHACGAVGEDDNVVAAHTLRLSSALLASGKDHEVLPLSGVTHMTPQEIVAENLLLHQLSFINRSLPSGQ